VKLSGAVCLVTGASSGIGRATAVELSRRGARVVALGRDAGRLAGIGERQVVQDLAEGVPADLGDVDVLVNNAGIGETADVERLVAVNLLAPIRLTRELAPRRVVFVSSIAGVVGPRHEAVYAATKAGLLAFAESLRYEGMGVSVVIPGVVATEFFERRGAPYTRRWPRPIPPEQVARAIADAIERERAEVFVPAWLGGVARLRGAAPGLFRALTSRFG
jgi:short-subunit dehydrogenase